MDTRELLIRASEIVKRHEHLARTQGAYFNVFDILDRATDEVKGHSAFIAEMLNPEGSHGQGNRFLNLFLAQLKAMEAHSAIDLPTDLNELQWKVSTELAFNWPESGRLDIALETPGILLAMENKVYHEDEERQLERYWHYGQFRRLDTYLLYLTLDGRAPSARSVGSMPKEGQRRVIEIDYGVFIDEWLGDCIQASSEIPFVREVLRQYRSLIRKLTSGLHNKDVIMEIADALMNVENLRAACEIQNALTEAKVRIQEAFWHDLGEELERRLPPKDRAFEKWLLPTREKIERNYKSKRGAHGLGVTATPLSPTQSLTFSIEVVWNVYYAFSVVENEARVKITDEEPLSGVINAIQRIDPQFRKELSVLRFVLPEKKQNFRAFDDECIKMLVPDERRRRAAELGDGFIDILTRFRENYVATP